MLRVEVLEKGALFKKIRENQGNFQFRIALFQNSAFLRTKSHAQLSVTIANVYPFYIILFCAVLIRHSSAFYETKNLNAQK